MIPSDYILRWRDSAPWPDIDFVEQDLVISRALVELYQSKKLSEKLAFRGGTALNKIFFKDPARYSEDIDLVQISSEPIGNVIDELRKCLDPWLGEPKRKRGEGRVTLLYRFKTESRNAPSKLKIEINTREHDSLFGFEKHSMKVENPWYTGTAEVTTYSLDELLGTKIRALYQRKKGRDIFDLWYANESCSVDWNRVLKSFHFYISRQGLQISASDFQKNVEAKLDDPLFFEDINRIKVAKIKYSMENARHIVEELVKRW
jgi:predicted nucleotidyltransferase component of viral defense system